MPSRGSPLLSRLIRFPPGARPVVPTLMRQREVFLDLRKDLRCSGSPFEEGFCFELAADSLPPVSSFRVPVCFHREHAPHSAMASSKEETKYAPDGPEAQRIARTIPYYPFKGIDRFYDIGGGSPWAKKNDLTAAD